MALEPRILLFQAGGRNVRLFAPEKGDLEILLYVHGGEEEAPACAAVATRGGAVAVIEDVDWNAELSPWPAPRAFARGEDFAGRADEYLQKLVRDVLPAVEETLPAPPRLRGIAGYSLAGLFAIYAAWRTDAFARAASMSGSLWYDGFVDFLRAHAPAPALKRCYLSLGDREPMARDPRLAAVGECTIAVRDLLEARGIEAALEMHLGGHFRDVPMRVERGLLALL